MTKNKIFKSKGNPDIQLNYDLFGRRCLYVEFKGTLTEEIATNVIDRSLEIAVNDSNEKITVVWNCLKMKNYTTEARDVCIKKIAENSFIMDNLFCISTSILIIAGAEILKYFSPLPLYVISNYEKLEDKFQGLNEKGL